MTNVTIPRADIRLIDDRGIASRDLYRWMRDITERVGGPTGEDTPDIEDDLDDLTEVVADLTSVAFLRRDVPVVFAPPAADSQVMLAALAFSPRQEPQRFVNDSQAVLAARIFGA